VIAFVVDFQGGDHKNFKFNIVISTMFHSRGMQSGGEIIGLNQRWLIFEESPLDQHEFSSNNVFDCEEENQQEPNADHVTLNAIECMLQQNLKKVTNGRNILMI
jgi:hypothetical protein